MRKRTVTLAAPVLAAALALAGCGGGGSGGDYKTCKAAVERAVAAGNSNASPPPACSHLSQAQIYKITQQVINEHLPTILQGGSSPATPGSVDRCAARVEHDSADGTLTYSGAQAHDPRLPAPCRPLSGGQLDRALKTAIRNLGGGG